MIQAVPFVGTAECGKAYDRAMSTAGTWRAYFANGERWTFKAGDAITAQNDARFWADFTRRELVAVAQID